MNRDAIVDLLNSKGYGVKVFNDFVPEDEDLPAITYSHINYKGDRVLSGSITGESDTWRISIICKTIPECDILLKQVRLLDNTSSNYFQKVLVININDEPAQPKSKVKRSFVDIKTFDTNRG